MDREPSETIAEVAAHYKHHRVLVTGAHGSIGAALTLELARHNVNVIPTDQQTLDVTSTTSCSLITQLNPTIIFHLAGAKHAPEGETSPAEAMTTNTNGTINVLNAANTINARVITASTCKACNPETAYGATKLLAERITLNNGGTVARYYNVIQTQGNVFDIWKNTPPTHPIRYTDCTRYFITLPQALYLTLWAGILLPARYTHDPGKPHHMKTIARNAYKHRVLQETPRRRGDRKHEPLHATNETITPTHVPGINQIQNPND